MTNQTRATLKGYFNTNDQPTEAQFADLIDSAVNVSEETALFPLLAGRAGGQTLYGGTGANDDLILYGTSSATRDTSNIILQPTAGMVGIGTSAPTAIGATILHVANPYYAVGDAGISKDIAIFSTSTSTPYPLQFSIGFRVDPSPANEYIFLQSAYLGDVPKNIVMQPLGGAVGIGRVPEYPLDVAAVAAATTNYPARFTGAATGHAVLAVYTDSGGAGIAPAMSTRNMIYLKPADYIEIYGNSTPIARFRDNGNVSIGATVDSGYKFEVAGTTSLNDALNFNKGASGYISWDSSNNILIQAGLAGGVYLRNSDGVPILFANSGGSVDVVSGALTMAEMAVAPNGVANKATVYARDNGSGKTMYCLKLGDDVEIVLATQA